MNSKLFLFAFSLCAFSAAPASVTSSDSALGNRNDTLVSGKIVEGSASSECARYDDDSDSDCWNSVHKADLRIVQHLGGAKISRKRISISYVSHAAVIPNRPMIFLLESRSGKSRYISTRPYIGGKHKGRLCLIGYQMEDVKDAGIGIDDNLVVCPDSPLD